MHSVAEKTRCTDDQHSQQREKFEEFCNDLKEALNEDVDEDLKIKTPNYPLHTKSNFRKVSISSHQI